jgi:hypothetical protein
MKITVPLSTAVLLALTLPAAAEAAPSAVSACDAAKGSAKKCKTGGRKDAKRTFSVLPKTWRVVAIDVDGTTTATDDDPDFTFTMAGTTKVTFSSAKSRPFGQADDLIATATISPMKTELTSKATWESEGTGPYDCSLTWPAGSLPTRLTVTAGPSRKFADALTFQWNFTPSGWQDCDRGDGSAMPAPSTPTAPSDLTSMTYPASSFRGAKKGTERRLKVDVDRTWSEGGITVRQTWKGSVTVKAAR